MDQFGRAQPVGGLNEKIEGFFAICQQRELTGEQGVIIPAANVRHLCLHQNLLDALQAKQFFIWAVDDMMDALPLLTGLTWDAEGQNNLKQVIQERIARDNAARCTSSLSVAASLVKLVYSKLIGLVQRTRVSYPASEITYKAY